MTPSLRAHPLLPAADIQRAKKFYTDKLGLRPEMELPNGTIFFKTRDSLFGIYATQYAGTAKNTAMILETDNLDRDIQELRSKGVVFEDYNLGDLKTVNGVASMGEVKSAWFKDSEGNIIALSQPERPLK